MLTTPQKGNWPYASPERWARAVANAAQEWNADRVVAEANQGGAMVASVLRAADCQMPIRLKGGCRRVIISAVPSVEPSITTMTSNFSAGMTCCSSAVSKRPTEACRW